MNDQHPGGNTGFVAVDPRTGEFMAGGETGILETPVLPSCDWRPYYPTNAAQLMKTSNGFSKGDTNACVSFAGCQSVETILNFQIKTRRMSAENLVWLNVNGYIGANGSVLISKRFTAKMSGTVPQQGNSLPNVWGSLKNDGAVPDAMWPMPTAQFDAYLAQHGGITTEQAWAIYYAPVPQAAIDLGKEFKARFPVLYEWIVYPAAPSAGQQLLKQLSVSPLEIATAVCNGWNTDDPIKACGAGTAHATLLGFVEPVGDYDVLDHYVPYQKQFAPDYVITYGMRGVVGQSLAQAPAAFHYTFTRQLLFNAASNDAAELKALQQALQYLKRPAGTPYMKGGVFGPFGPQTKTALGLFQTDHGIKDAEGQGTNFGPQGRAALNAALLVK